MRAAVVWFRSDLRVHDHAPLAAAMAWGLPVVGLYAFDPFWFRPGKAGAHRARFLLEAVADLRASLARLNVPLAVRTLSPDEAVRSLGVEVARLDFSAEPASEERGRERLARAGAARVQAHETFLLSPDPPFPVERTPDLFTSYRREVERGGLRVPAEVPTPRPQAERPTVDEGPIPTLADLGLAEPPEDPAYPDGRRLRGGETAALARLREWMWDKDRLRVYKETRNGMLDPDDASHLSAYLAHGCVSPRRVHAEIRRYEAERVANDSTYWLVFELLWRDFFRLTLMRHGDRLFRPEGIQNLRLEWPGGDDRFDAWREGRTGFPIVDAAMRELSVSGYLSNRARQIVGSFLTKNLGVDWRRGAAWFEARLVDYEVGANWGNWQYVAGVGNDAREFRLFDLRRQAENYDAKAEFVRHWLPELRGLRPQEAHEPWRQSRVAYPPRIVDFRASANEMRAIYELATRRPPGRRRLSG